MAQRVVRPDYFDFHLSRYSERLSPERLQGKSEMNLEGSISRKQAEKINGKDYEWKCGMVARGRRECFLELLNTTRERDGFIMACGVSD